MVDETGGDADGDGDTIIPVTGITLNKSSTTLPVGAAEQLTAAVDPADASDQSMSWSSDNESVATVDADGLVTGAAEGTATITVTTTDGGFTASCDVAVQTYGRVRDFQKISSTEGDFTGILDVDDFFGRSVTSLGDLDGDGTADLAVGAWGDDDGGDRHGAVWVLFLDGVN